jgi:ribosome biogenesis GTPase
MRAYRLMAQRSPPRSRQKKPDTRLSTDKLEVAASQNGRVISNYGQTLSIEDDAGRVHRCTTRKKIEVLVCGDKVLWQPTTAEEGVVIELHPRKTLLARPDSRGDLKPIAANVEQLLVVTVPQSANPAKHGITMELQLDTTLIDRYLVAAQLSSLHAVIVVNKIDLLAQETLAQLTQSLELYRNIGYEVLLTSAKLQLGMDALKAILKDHTSVFSGPSGVGKSSLVKAVLPEQAIRIGAVSAASGAGRHTTTLATLYHLPHGGSLIDSPGVRDFGLWHAARAEIAQGFVEFQPYAAACRFANCSHLAEPGCAVQQAAESGNIGSSRMRSYRHIVESLQD